MIASTARPKTITIIIAMLILLVVVSTVSTVTNLIPRAGFGANGRQFNGTPQARGNLGSATPGPGTPFAGGSGTGTRQGSAGNFPGTNGNSGTGTGQGFNGNFQGRANQGGFSLFTITRALGLNVQVIGIINIAIPIIGIALLLLSAYGVWKAKGWGLNLATLLAVIFLIGALPALFATGGRNVNWLRIGLNALSLVGTLPILVLSFLPSVRDFFPKPAPKPRTR